jgi:hypothetical protein
MVITGEMRQWAGPPSLHARKEDCRRLLNFVLREKGTDLRDISWNHFFFQKKGGAREMEFSFSNKSFLLAGACWRGKDEESFKAAGLLPLF